MSWQEVICTVVLITAFAIVIWKHGWPWGRWQ